MVSYIIFFFCTLRFQIFKYCPNHTSIKSYLFSWCINLNFQKMYAYYWFCAPGVTYNLRRVGNVTSHSVLDSVLGCVYMTAGLGMDRSLNKQHSRSGVTIYRYVKDQITSYAGIYCVGLCSGGAAPNSHTTAGQVLYRCIDALLFSVATATLRHFC